jgi:DMSO/TMAO reductase YedYZ molybdopterin-dependent catalytic subunit
MSALLGAEIVFGKYLPAGVIPVALAGEGETLPGKHPGLVVLNDRPVNAETPPHLLDDAVTPAERLFVRNNGLPPGSVDIANWRLAIDGESVKHARSYSLAELKSRFTEASYQLTLECGGNGRAEFDPPARGNQWTTGAVGCPRWTGVRLADVLSDCGVEDDAVYVAYYGADLHLSGNPEKTVISRGVPIAKAMEPESMIAWAINGEDLPPLNGYPLRLVFGGWPASTSGKWLRRISVRNRVHDGPKMGGYSYRVPCEPVAPGAEVAKEDMCIIESMPVKSLVTFPRTGLVHARGKALEVRGQAWAGDLAVSRVDVSIDFGQSWQGAELGKPANRHAWQQWRQGLDFPGPGYYEVWARATDSRGKSQPMVLPGWNPRGYLNNACHRIAVKVV